MGRGLEDEIGDVENVRTGPQVGVENVWPLDPFGPGEFQTVSSYGGVRQGVIVVVRKVDQLPGLRPVARNEPKVHIGSVSGDRVSRRTCVLALFHFDEEITSGRFPLDDKLMTVLRPAAVRQAPFVAAVRVGEIGVKVPVGRSSTVGQRLGCRVVVRPDASVGLEVGDRASAVARIVQRLSARRHRTHPEQREKAKRARAFHRSCSGPAIVYNHQRGVPRRACRSKYTTALLPSSRSTSNQWRFT